MSFPKEILFASTNLGKLREIASIARGFGVKVISPASLIPDFGPFPDVCESGNTYFENARLKAEAFYVWSKMPTLADDTGLEVAALNGRPGVRSARYAHDHATMAENIELLLFELKETIDRSALFRCVLILKTGEKGSDLHSAQGVLQGSIGSEESGMGGFGYDSVFLVSNTSKTLASLKDENFDHTHRLVAFKNLYSQLKA